MDSKEYIFFHTIRKYSFYYFYSCGNSGTYCGVASYGNCGATACGAGLCCTRYG